MKEVFVDLDGVLADFVKRFDEKYAVLTSLSYDELVEYKKNFAKDGFFLELEKMPHAVELLLYLEEKGYKPTILTSVGKFDSEVVASDKFAWLNDNFPFCDFKAFRWVTSSVAKAKYVKDKNSVLIDDRVKSCDPWVEAGGTAIFYDGFENVKGELDRIL